MISTHNLDFEVFEYDKKFPDGYYWQRFKVGTTEGFFTTNINDYTVYSIYNKESGNGHLEDLLEWFNYMGETNKKDLIFLDAFNRRFKKHLIEKRGFEEFGEDHLIKRFYHE